MALLHVAANAMITPHPGIHSDLVAYVDRLRRLDVTLPYPFRATASSTPLRKEVGGRFARNRSQNSTCR